MSYFAPSRFPQGRLSQAWDYLVNEMKNNAVLRAAVDDWHVYDGEIEDQQPADAGRVSLELRTDGGNLQWTDETRHGGTWNIRLELTLPTRSERVALDAWEAVYNAMPWPSESRNYDTLVNSCGVFNIIMVGPAFVRDDSQSGEGMKVTGTIQLQFNVSPYS